MRENKKLREMISVSEEDRKEIKKVQLEILLYFKNFCEKNNLSFYLYGGSLLGAIRHNGYIPWDDDIDVCMPRLDYNLFLKLINEKSDDYYVENHFVDKFYFPHFSKLMKKNTRYVEFSAQNINYNAGIYIDIFPINGYPKSKFNQFFYKTIVNTLNFKGTPKLAGYKILHKNDKGYSKRKMAVIFSKIIWFWITKNRALCWRDNFIKKHQYPDSDLCVSGVTFKRVMPKNYFTGLKMVTFEGYQMPAPEKYQEYLRAHYGNYMKLPPEEERIGHHYVVELKY